MERFQIHSSIEIGHILKNIQKKKRLLRMRFDHTTETAITTLLDVDIPNRRTVIDQVSLDAQNKMRLLMKENRVGFETVMDKIGISFISEKIRPCFFESAPALTMPFPLKLMRFEKRKTHRVHVANSSLRIPLAAGEGQRYAMAEIQDLSVNGVSFFDSAFLLDDTVGKMYPDSFLYLPEMKPITLGLEIRNTQAVSIPGGRVCLRLGCRFLDLPSSQIARLQGFILKQRHRDLRIVDD